MQVNKSLCKRMAADVRAVVVAIEDYRTDFGTYPVAMTNEGLASAVTPKYIRAVQPHVDYFSDGVSYAIFARWGEDGPVTNNCLFEYRDGEYVSWPEGIGPK